MIVPTAVPGPFVVTDSLVRAKSVMTAMTGILIYAQLDAEMRVVAMDSLVRAKSAMMETETIPTAVRKLAVLQDVETVLRKLERSATMAIV